MSILTAPWAAPLVSSHSLSSLIIPALGPKGIYAIGLSLAPSNTSPSPIPPAPRSSTPPLLGCASLRADPSAGRPNPTTFPFDSITLHLKPPLGGGKKQDVDVDGELLNVAMQYGPSAGIPHIRKWLSDLQTHVHKRQPGNWAVSMGSGSQDLMSKVG